MVIKGYKLSKRGKYVIFSFLCVVFIAIFSCVYLISQDLPNNEVVPISSAEGAKNIDESNPEQNEDLTETQTPIEECQLTLYFRPGDTELTLESKSALDLFVKMEELIEDSTIYIEGNCATTHIKPLNDYQKQLNRAFALKRAETVANYIEEKGIDSSRLEVTSNGSSKVSDNRTWINRRRNRKVDVIFQVNKQN